MKVESPSELNDRNCSHGGPIAPNITAASIHGTGSEDTSISLKQVQTQNFDEEAEKGARFGTPLTSMFRRSSSAPATSTRASLTASCPSPGPEVFVRRDSFSGVSSNGYAGSLLASIPPSSERHDARGKHDTGVTTNEANTRKQDVNNLSPAQSPSLSFVSTPEYDASGLSSEWVDVRPDHYAPHYRNFLTNSCKSPFSM